MALTCEEVRGRFSALWEKALNPSEEAEVKRHIEVCSDCREEFARFDKTLRMLHSVEEAEVPEGFLSGIYEKIKEREDKGLTPEKIPRKGYAKWKVPAQAAAMVAIIFLTVYLTRMMPGESPRMKTGEEPKPSAPAVREEKWDRVHAAGEPEKAERKKEVHGHLGEKPGAAKVEEKQEPIPSKVPGPGQREQQSTAAPSPQRMKSDVGLANKPAEERVEESKGGEGSGAPHPAITETKESEKSLRDRGRASGEPTPSREFVVKSSDRKKSLWALRQLVKKFGGETLTTETNGLLVSLPRSLLAEFGKELEGIGASAEARQAVSSAVRKKGANAEKEAKRELSQGKDNEIEALDAAKEGRVIVRIVLSEE